MIVKITNKIVKIGRGPVTAANREGHHPVRRVQEQALETRIRASHTASKAMLRSSHMAAQSHFLQPIHHHRANLAPSSTQTSCLGNKTDHKTSYMIPIQVFDLLNYVPNESEYDD